LVSDCEQLRTLYSRHWRTGYQQYKIAMTIFTNNKKIAMTLFTNKIACNRITFFCLFICSTFVFPAHAYTPDKSLKEKTRAYSNELIALSDNIDKADYEVDALAEKLEYDVALAVDFVSKEIFYSPYIGVMRGPQGTISTNSGSSWDHGDLSSAPEGVERVRIFAESLV
jgi:hypothetical protein